MLHKIKSHRLRLPPNVKCRKIKNNLHVEGPLGKLVLNLPLDFQQKGLWLVIENLRPEEKARLQQAALGVAIGYKKQIHLVGVGYRARLEKEVLFLDLGYSHPIKISLPQGISLECLKGNVLRLKACDLSLLNQFTASLRRFRFPDPYKAKGVLYKGENIKTKEGKKT
uniref:Ribosomal protein L6 n=1 Tax=Schizocladia ischiensis TaxID=196139 RepID=A0A7S6UA42_9STRA|nr:ribosomal protein L6 [Schizocladia ischiensis]QOW07615.1 ribosomal protein L6 [Schizocladia ischiensis]